MVKCTKKQIRRLKIVRPGVYDPAGAPRPRIRPCLIAELGFAIPRCRSWAAVRSGVTSGDLSGPNSSEPVATSIQSALKRRGRVSILSLRIPEPALGSSRELPISSPLPEPRCARAASRQPIAVGTAWERPTPRIAAIAMLIAGRGVSAVDCTPPQFVKDIAATCSQNRSATGLAASLHGTRPLERAQVRQNCRISSGCWRKVAVVGRRDRNPQD
jgi:hypothetical protein